MLNYLPSHLLGKNWVTFLTTEECHPVKVGKVTELENYILKHLMEYLIKERIISGH